MAVRVEDMSGLLQRIAGWLLKKLGGGLVIALIGVGSTGLWLYLRESLDFEEKRDELMRLLNGEQAHLIEARAQVERRQAAYATERQQKLLQIQESSHAIHALEDLDSTWEKLFGDRDRQREYSTRRRELEAKRKQWLARVEEIDHQSQLETYTLEGLDLALGKLDKKKADLDKNRSPLGRYVHEAWDRVRWTVLWALLLWLFGPLLLSAVLFYLIAPWITRRQPIRLKPLLSALPEVSESKAALDLSLEPGQILRVKERYLQASDEELGRGTRLLFDWKLPITSLACGLTEMVDLEHAERAGVLRATLSDKKESLNELCHIRLEEGASVVLRPRCIAALILPAGGRCEIRRHWVFFRWQAWVSLQFRYFEFRGPVSLIISGGRGIRVEKLLREDRPEGGSRRVDSASLLGFTPNLAYRPVRAETFWAYYRGQNPLFDDLFSGPGLFLCQASGQEEGFGQKFWGRLRRLGLKLIGA